MKYLPILLLLFVGFSCRKNCSEQSLVPACISAKIEYLKYQPEGNPTYSVYQYNYGGRKVYFFPAQCCDQYSDLYDNNCNLVCHPDGGFSGGGDGSCQDFFTKRTNEVLIWKDNR